MELTKLVNLTETQLGGANGWNTTVVLREEREHWVQRGREDRDGAT